jgi:hypothetical protein
MSAPLLRRAGRLEDESGLHLITLSVLLLQALGPDYLDWETDHLWEDLTERYGEIGTMTKERINALRLLHSNSAFWEEWEVFEKVTAAILGEMPLFSLMQPPEPEEIAIAVTTALRFDRHDWDEDVKAYMVAACLDDGLWYFSGTPLGFLHDTLLEADNRLGIERDFSSVDGALAARSGFYDDPDTAAQVQANKVREVELVLRRYNDAVEKQLKEI